MIANPWLPAGPQVSGHAPLQLICFPYAGASASAFAHWHRRLPGFVEVRAVQLPGRGIRLDDTAILCFRRLVDALTPALSPILDRPFAFFGHSMGALIAFEMARALRRLGQPLPRQIFVSGRRAPQLEGPELPDPHAADEVILQSLRSKNGTPPELLEHEELMRLTLPAVRADLSVCRTYDYIPEAPLDSPLFTFVGDADRESDEAFVRGWRVHTARDWRAFTFAGGHFYFQDPSTQLFSVLGALLSDAL